MEQFNEVLRYKKCVFREVKEHQLESQLHLPDYYPDICRIIFCQVKPYTEHCNVENDRIVMDALAEIRLLYCDVDNKMQLFTTEVRYSKNAILKNNVSNAVLQCSQTAVSATYRTVGPRRVDVKASVAISMTVSEQAEMKLRPEELSGMEVLCEERDFFDLHAYHSGSFVIDESFSVQDERLKQSRILIDNSRVTTTEIKLVKDKILIKGYLEMELSCLYEKENIIFKYIENIPFSQVIDLYGVLEDDVCHIVFDPQKLNLSFRENGECDVSLSVHAVIIAGTHVNLSVVLDLFAVNGHAEVHMQENTIGTDCRPVSENFLCSSQIEKIDCGNLQILTAQCSGLDYSLRHENGKIIAKGTVDISVVAAEETECRYITRKIQFEQSRDFTQCERGSVFGSIVCKSVSCGKSADALNLKAELELTGCVIGEDTIHFVDSCRHTVSDADDAECIISLYFAQEGECIWTIAKENQIPVQILRSVNDLNEDTLKEQSILLLMKQ